MVMVMSKMIDVRDVGDMAMTKMDMGYVKCHPHDKNDDENDRNDDTGDTNHNPDDRNDTLVTEMRMDMRDMTPQMTWI